MEVLFADLDATLAGHMHWSSLFKPDFQRSIVARLQAHYDRHHNVKLLAYGPKANSERANWAQTYRHLIVTGIIAGIDKGRQRKGQQARPQQKSKNK